MIMHVVRGVAWVDSLRGAMEQFCLGQWYNQLLGITRKMECEWLLKHAEGGSAVFLSIPFCLLPIPFPLFLHFLPFYLFHHLMGVVAPVATPLLDVCTMSRFDE